MKKKLETEKDFKPVNPYLPTIKIMANGEFHPVKHPFCTYAQQKRNAKKRKNINKHKKV